MSITKATLQVEGATLQLHPYKALFWEEARTLLVADLHLGKAAHFRKAGIPVPPEAGDVTWDKLIGLLLEYRPKRMLILGDLFHSAYNPEWEEFGALLQQFGSVKFELVTGNHDILSDFQYEKFGLEVHGDGWSLGPFLFTHEPLEEVPEGWFNLSGHVHPAVRLAGHGKQWLRLPCFYFNDRQGILPAFGAFTGMATLQPKTGDRVFVVADNAVVDLT